MNTKVRILFNVRKTRNKIWKFIFWAANSFFSLDSSVMATPPSRFSKLLKKQTSWSCRSLSLNKYKINSIKKQKNNERACVTDCNALAGIQSHIKKRGKEMENDSKCGIHEKKDKKKLVLHQQI